MSGSQNKYINIKYLATRKRVKERKVIFKHTSTESMIANPLTKRYPKGSKDLCNPNGT